MNTTSGLPICGYCSPGGWHCDQPAMYGHYCFWHDKSHSKAGIELKHTLEQWAQSGRPLDGLQLARTDLRGVNLVNRDHKDGYSCRDADFYRADLSGAHLFKLNARGSSFMKANLAGANLHCADFRGCNLLGTRLTHARLENIQWGDHLRQELQALRLSSHRQTSEANDLWQEAEEVSRNIRKQCEKQGMFENAGFFFQKEMVCRRYQMPLLSARRLISKVVDLFCGYGESPLRVVLFSLAMIVCCALIYFVMGVTTGADMLHYSMDVSVSENLLRFLNSLYFSIVTFTTLGYGDIAPVGVARFVAAMEAFFGSFTMALFVVVFVKKMTR
ncbi:ion channel [Bacterioplanoides sp.]|uniref:ion channel n=1 Tax=Bacterioplanoides sp. TaxID=2066072 RepID=UPI003B5BB00F